MRVSAAFAALLCVVPFAASAQSQDINHLAGDTVLIVRHAEKPAAGRELTSAGRARAQAYITYFEPFHEAGWNVHVDALYAGSDSPGSMRPRLTLEPLHVATGLPLDSTVSTKDPELLVQRLRGETHGRNVLICWRHGEIPQLLTALGSSPAILPGGKWPDDTYDWVVALQFDAAGKVSRAQLLQEHLGLP